MSPRSRFSQWRAKWLSELWETLGWWAKFFVNFVDDFVDSARLAVASPFLVDCGCSINLDLYPLKLRENIGFFAWIVALGPRIEFGSSEERRKSSSRSTKESPRHVTFNFNSKKWKSVSRLKHYWPIFPKWHTPIVMIVFLIVCAKIGHSGILLFCLGCLIPNQPRLPHRVS